LRLRAGRHGHRAYLSRYPPFEDTRLLTGAEAMRSHQNEAASDNDGDEQRDSAE
jgi:hypothetical protein